MSKITWDGVGERLFETGLDHGVLFPMGSTGTYDIGVPWNGLVAVNESSSGAEPNDHYADNMQYATILTAEKFKATIEAFTSPEEFEACDGSAEVATGVYIGQQARKKFGLSYRTKIGNDVDNQDHGYKLHLVYGCLAAPSERNRQTINETPEPMTLSWEVSTTPVEVEGHKPTAHLVVDSTKVDASALASLEAMLYGGDSVEPKLPTPAEVIELFAS